MGSIAHKPNPKVREIFDALEKYLEFCKEFGYRFNEGDLYNFKAYPWQQYQKFSAGKNAKNMWEIDASRFSSRRY